ncbi:MAG: hypothetical protein FWC79_06915 [Oscillospiraceae bacterium]|nr:hypothetical protein [Oscillospiraceae bacterium]
MDEKIEFDFVWESKSFNEVEPKTLEIAKRLGELNLIYVEPKLDEKGNIVIRHPGLCRVEGFIDSFALGVNKEEPYWFKYTLHPDSSLTKICAGRTKEDSGVKCSMSSCPISCAGYLWYDTHRKVEESNVFCMSVGVKLKEKGSVLKYKVMNNEYEEAMCKIQYNDQAIECPEMVLAFWETFLEGEFLDVAKKSFVEQTQLEEGLFDETFEILAGDGLILKTENIYETLSKLIPVRSDEAKEKVSEEELNILQTFDGVRSVEEIKNAIGIEDKESFYNKILQLAKKKVVFWIGSK